MTRIIEGQEPCSPSILALNLLLEQGSIELQHDAAARSIASTPIRWTRF